MYTDTNYGTMSEASGEAEVSELLALRDVLGARLERELGQATSAEDYATMEHHLRVAASLAGALATAGHGVPWVAKDAWVPSAIRQLRAYALEG